MSLNSLIYATDISTGNNVVKTNMKKTDSFDLSKYELRGIRKKNWSQRLKWFESKIINYYKDLNKTNILIVGDQDFLDTFKFASKKNNWNSNFTYSSFPDSNNKYDLVIDSKYNPRNFKFLYENENVSSFQYVYLEILLNEALEFFKENDIKYYFFEGPITRNIKNLNDIDKTFIGKNWKNDENWMESFNKEIQKIIDILYQNCTDCKDFLNKRYVEELSTSISNGKYRIKKDCDHGNLLQIRNGCRRTYYSPENSPNCSKIYICGPCIADGLFACDKCTIESFIQNKIRNKNQKYEVINYGSVGGRDWINDLEHILDTPLKKGDCVVHLTSRNSVLNKVFEKFGIKVHETTSLFDRPNDIGPWMIDDGYHINCSGNKVIADYIYKILEKDLNNDKYENNSVRYKFENEIDTFLEENPEFKSYLSDLKKIRDKNNIKGKIGSIVMNCNPFTLGHRYLIDQALSEVDHLYIFIVEEDKSIFPFKDRMDLVQKGISDINDRITVLPSGKWMISLLTFPEYFSKDSLQEAEIDPSKDVNLFGKYICPSLNITQRFVGEEPFDSVTRQYNDSMKSILPKYGIKFTEIPRRLCSNKNVISASKVREIIKEGLYSLSDEKIKNLKQYVSDSTIDYLRQIGKLK